MICGRSKSESCFDFGHRVFQVCLCGESVADSEERLPDGTLLGLGDHGFPVYTATETAREVELRAALQAARDANARLQTLTVALPPDPGVTEPELTRFRQRMGL